MKLTAAQTEIWLAQHLSQDASVLGVPAIVDIAAALDVQALRSAYHTLIGSADILRTVILDDGHGQPDAHIEPPGAITLDVVRAGGSDPHRFVADWLRNRVRRPFALDRPLIDAALIEFGSDRSMLYVNQHHIITDGWSIQLLIRRLATLYASARRELLESEDAVPPFRNYVEFEHAQRESAEYARARAYWTERLQQTVPAPALYGRTARRTSRTGVRLRCPLGTRRTAALETLVARLGTRDESPHRTRLAVFTACLAAYQWRVSGAATLSIGLPYHNRPPQFRETLGLFVNVVPIAVSLELSSRFSDVIDAVSRELTSVFAHARYSLAHRIHAPIYHSTVNYHPHGITTFAGAPASARLIFAGHIDEPVGLEITRDPHTGALILEFDLDDEAFPTYCRRPAIGHFLAVLDACLADPSQPIVRPELTSPSERRQLLSLAAGPDVPLPAGTCIDLIADRAREAPDELAVTEGTETMSYRELVMAARAVAAQLQRDGVHPGERVAVMVERSIPAVVAMLGVLCARAVYVPIDPSWPEAHVAFILRDAGITRAIRPREWTDLMSSPAGDAIRPEGDDAAYIIYTSGSTGQPKGVTIRHRSLLNHCLASIRAYGLVATDRVMQFHPLMFDAAIEELFPTWSAGATVVLRPPGVVVDLAALERFLADERITVVDLPTSFWHEWTASARHRHASLPSSVRIVIVGGEQPAARSYAAWRQQVAAQVRWVNGYGPTEATVTATVFEPADEQLDDPIPMGRPVQNVMMYVLDSERHLAPLGVPGELYIGGVGVADGYVNHPELTADRFVTDPVRPTQRVYRTGDLARLRDDGQLEYLGRIDEQVKVRGFRIELSEIEAVLARHPAISQVAVLLTEADTERRLVAYFVPTHALSDDDLRTYLRERLPVYVHPQAFVRLPALPLTDRGKVDKRALRQHPVPPAPSANMLAARNPIEAELMAIWRDLLGVEIPAPTCSFVELGGHSLLAARLVQHIAERFGHRLSLASLFPDTTVERLAVAIRRAADDTCSRAVSIVTPDSPGPLPLLVYFHGDYGGAGLYTRRLADLLGPEQPLAIVHPHGVDGHAVPATIEAMADDRQSDVEALVTRRPVVLAGFCNGGLVAYEIARRLSARGHRVLGVVLVDAVINSGRYRLLSRIVARVAKARRLSPRQARDLFLRWRDRQATIEHLLGLAADSPHRFESLGDRLKFVAASVARKLRSLGARSLPAPTVATPPKDELWQAYLLAIAAYVPPAPPTTVALIASDELHGQRAIEEWHHVIPRLRVERIAGHHLAAVTRELPRVAALLTESIRAWIPQH